MCRADFLDIPLSRRRAKKGKTLIKVVRLPEGKFLSEWTFDDIGREPFGITSARPVVYMQDSYDALEKTHWCYGRGMTPLNAEADPKVANYTAEKYGSDQLIVDERSLLALRPFIDSRGGQFEMISVFGSSFDTQVLGSFIRSAKQMRLVLALPETGVIATASFAEYPVFTVAEDCIVHDAESLTITKEYLMTPLRRYDTGIAVVPKARKDGAVTAFAV